MSSNLDKAVKKAIKRAMNLTKRPNKVVNTKPLKKAPAKRELLPQSTACGMVACGAPNIPPANNNKKSKL